jgi:hypothetical protein
LISAADAGDPPSHPVIASIAPAQIAPIFISDTPSRAGNAPGSCQHRRPQHEAVAAR